MLPTSSRSLRDFSQVLSACGSIFAGLCQPCTHLPSTAVVYTSYLRISTTALMHSGGPEKVLSPLFGLLTEIISHPPTLRASLTFPFLLSVPQGRASLTLLLFPVCISGGGSLDHQKHRYCQGTLPSPCETALLQ